LFAVWGDGECVDITKCVHHISIESAKRYRLDGEYLKSIQEIWDDAMNRVEKWKMNICTQKGSAALINSRSFFKRKTLNILADDFVMNILGMKDCHPKQKESISFFAKKL